jgi:hypothetical protein
MVEPARIVSTSTSVVHGIRLFCSIYYLIAICPFAASEQRNSCAPQSGEPHRHVELSRSLELRRQEEQVLFRPRIALGPGRLWQMLMFSVLFSPAAAAGRCRTLLGFRRAQSSLFYAACLAAALATVVVSNAAAQVPAPARVWMPFSHLGTGATFGTTGIGVEAAVPYGAYWNIRAGVSYLGYSDTFKTGTSPLDGHLRLGGVRVGVDWYPKAGGFHISLGMLVPNLTQASAHINLEPGKTLKVEGATYTTDSANPFRGSGHSEISPIAPVLTVGWGNLIPRDYHQRWSIPIEVGAAYEGPPTVHVSYTGDICPVGQSCRPAAADSGFNDNLNTAIRDANSNLDRYARLFPIITVGFGYRF